MKPVTLKFELTPQTLEETREVLEAFLEALVVANMALYRRFPGAPCCPKCAGVRYAPPKGKAKMSDEQRFVGVERMVVEGYGSCGDVAAMVCARMRSLEGKPDARVIVQQQREGGRHFHAVVAVDGSIVDATEEMLPGSRPGCGCGVPS